MDSFDMAAAAGGAWRVFDNRHPEPGYHEFDSLSARHPDLYHLFALSTDVLLVELHGLIDLRDKVILDVGAGTGRSAIGAAQGSAQVIAVDAFRSVVEFAVRAVAEAGYDQTISYLRGHREHLPVGDSSVDVVLCVWAELDYGEAYRVLKPGGHLVHMACVPGTVCGELTDLLGRDQASAAASWLTAPTQGGPPRRDWFKAGCPPFDSVAEAPGLAGVRLAGGLHRHEFTRMVNYGDVREAAAIVYRLWGPLAAQYLLYRKQATIAWRLCISYGQIQK